MDTQRTDQSDPVRGKVSSRAKLFTGLLLVLAMVMAFLSGTSNAESGEDGPTIFETNRTVLVPPGDTIRHVTSCNESSRYPNGGTVIDGWADSFEGGEDLELIDQGPNAEGDGWFTEVTNHGDSAHAYLSWAECEENLPPEEEEPTTTAPPTEEPTTTVPPVEEPSTTTVPPVDVGGIDEEPTPPESDPQTETDTAPTPPAEVKDATATPETNPTAGASTLPRTGSSTTNFLVMGLAMSVLGAVLVLLGRRRPANRIG